MVIYHKNLNLLTINLNCNISLRPPNLQYVIPALNSAGELQIVYIIILQHYQTESSYSEIQILVKDHDTNHDSHDGIDTAESHPFFFRSVFRSGRTQSAWPACRSRGSVTVAWRVITIATLNGNYELKKKQLFIELSFIWQNNI